ncbi:hypothetical protein [Pseudonocardia adelaidensis]|uniref:hypothetical protein n=1 Tax=Pseudonocardia adelaidensis TaxID=648754 RepID=UPI0031EFEA18
MAADLAAPVIGISASPRTQRCADMAVVITTPRAPRDVLQFRIFYRLRVTDKLMNPRRSQIYVRALGEEHSHD